MRLAEFMTQDVGRDWGRWELTDDGTALRIMDGTTPRYVNLTHCNTPAHRWFWVQHYGGKGWITPEDVAGLVNALSDLEYEQETK